MKLLGWLGIAVVAFGILTLTGAVPLSVANNCESAGGLYTTINGVAGCYYLNPAPAANAQVTLTKMPTYSTFFAYAISCTEPSSNPSTVSGTTDSTGTVTFIPPVLTLGQFVTTETCSNGITYTVTLNIGPAYSITVGGQLATSGGYPSVFTGVSFASSNPPGLPCSGYTQPSTIGFNAQTYQLPPTNCANFQCTQPVLNIAWVGIGSGTQTATITSTSTVVAPPPPPTTVTYSTTATTSASTTTVTSGTTVTIAGYFSINGQPASGGTISVPKVFPVSATVTSGASSVISAYVIVQPICNPPNPCATSASTTLILPAAGNGNYGPVDVSLPAPGSYAITGSFTLVSGGSLQALSVTVGQSSSSFSPVPNSRLVSVVIIAVGGVMVVMGRKGRRH